MEFANLAKVFHVPPGWVLLGFLLVYFPTLHPCFPAPETPEGVEPAEESALTEGSLAPLEIEEAEPNNATFEVEKVPLVTNVFYSTPLSEVLTDIATQTEKTIVTDVSVQGLITCELTDVPLEKALEIVLAPGGYIYKQMDGFIMVGSPDPESPSFAQMSDTKSLRLNFIPAEEALEMLSEPLRKYVTVRKGGDAVSITAPPKLIERITADLHSFDVRPQQVLLDARSVVMESGDLLNLGLQWDWPQVTAGAYSDWERFDNESGNPFPDFPWGLQIGYTPGKEFTNSLNLTLNLLSSNAEATVLSNPKVMVQDGEEAELSVMREEYFEIFQDSAYYRTAELEQIEVGTVLKITPRITKDGEIVLEFNTEVSDVIARGENNLPVVTRRTAHSTVCVEDGGTAAVAGLVDRRTSQLLEKVPVLHKMPVVGRFFKNDQKDGTNRQVAVFVTARLVPEGGFVAEEARLPQRKIKPVGPEFQCQLQGSLHKLGIH